MCLSSLSMRGICPSVDQRIGEVRSTLSSPIDTHTLSHICSYLIAQDGQIEFGHWTFDGDNESERRTSTNWIRSIKYSRSIVDGEEEEHWRRWSTN